MFKKDKKKTENEQQLLEIDPNVDLIPPLNERERAKFLSKFEDKKNIDILAALKRAEEKRDQALNIKIKKSSLINEDFLIQLIDERIRLFMKKNNNNNNEG